MEWEIHENKECMTIVSWKFKYRYIQTVALKKILLLVFFAIDYRFVEVFGGSAKIKLAEFVI